MRNKKIPVTVLLGSILLLVIILLVIAAPLFTSYAPDEAIAERLQKFSFSHPFGTDRYGRDIFCRTLYGGRTTLTACFIALAMALFIGTFFGIVTGMRSYGLLDTILMRVIDVLMAFPFMVFAMVFAALWGTGLVNLLIAVVAVWWVPFARLAKEVVPWSVHPAQNTNYKPELVSNYVASRAKRYPLCFSGNFRRRENCPLLVRGSAPETL